MTTTKRAKNLYEILVNGAVVWSYRAKNGRADANHVAMDIVGFYGHSGIKADVCTVRINGVVRHHFVKQVLGETSARTLMVREGR